MCMWMFDDPRMNFERVDGLLNFCTVGYGVCVINTSYSFQRKFLKLCRHIADILKMCMWVFDGDK